MSPLFKQRLPFCLTLLSYLIFNITVQIISGAQSKVLVSRHMENRDVGCQIHGKETANWFVTKDLNFTHY